MTYPIPYKVTRAGTVSPKKPVSKVEDKENTGSPSQSESLSDVNAGLVEVSPSRSRLPLSSSRNHTPLSLRRSVSAPALREAYVRLSDDLPVANPSGRAPHQSLRRNERVPPASALERARPSVTEKPSSKNTIARNIDVANEDRKDNKECTSMPPPPLTESEKMQPAGVVEAIAPTPPTRGQSEDKILVASDKQNGVIKDGKHYAQAEVTQCEDKQKKSLQANTSASTLPTHPTLSTDHTSNASLSLDCPQSVPDSVDATRKLSTTAKAAPSKGKAPVRATTSNAEDCSHLIKLHTPPTATTRGPTTKAKPPASKAEAPTKAKASRAARPVHEVLDRNPSALQHVPPVPVVGKVIKGKGKIPQSTKAVQVPRQPIIPHVTPVIPATPGPSRPQEAQRLDNAPTLLGADAAPVVSDSRRILKRKASTELVAGRRRSKTTYKPKPEEERKHVTQACDLCREKKRKCDRPIKTMGNFDTCLVCTKMNHNCTYLRAAGLRGAKPGRRHKSLKNPSDEASAEGSQFEHANDEVVKHLPATVEASYPSTVPPVIVQTTLSHQVASVQHDARITSTSDVHPSFAPQPFLLDNSTMPSASAFNFDGFTRETMRSGGVVSPPAFSNEYEVDRHQSAIAPFPGSQSGWNTSRYSGSTTDSYLASGGNLRILSSDPRIDHFESQSAFSQPWAQPVLYLDAHPSAQPAFIHDASHPPHHRNYHHTPQANAEFIFMPSPTMSSDRSYPHTSGGTRIVNPVMEAASLATGSYTSTINEQYSAMESGWGAQFVTDLPDTGEPAVTTGPAVYHSQEFVMPHDFQDTASNLSGTRDEPWTGIELNTNMTWRTGEGPSPANFELGMEPPVHYSNAGLLPVWQPVNTTENPQVQQDAEHFTGENIFATDFATEAGMGGDVATMGSLDGTNFETLDLYYSPANF